MGILEEEEYKEDGVDNVVRDLRWMGFRRWEKPIMGREEGFVRGDLRRMGLRRWRKPTMGREEGFVRGKRCTLQKRFYQIKPKPSIDITVACCVSSLLTT
ncbi:hypothetical protein O3M35_010920 [Rhynocoris fuscipes]|uniref:Uncharacterized protein n=1 Tax=Rhynocoris fuscipes TaxID=488301 RepID=A0AAW1D3W3_9HEMI